MFEGISTSDWHFEALANHFPQDHIQRQLETIDRIYNYAVEHGIKHVIIPGDITDKYTMADTTKELLLQHFRKYEGIIESWYCGGNHDWADNTQTSMDLIKRFCDWDFLKSLHIFLRPKQVEIDGVIVNFLPFPARKSIKHKKPCLNFCHTEAIGALGDNGRPLRTKKDLKVDERDFTISGHIHLYQYLEAKRFLYNGSPYQKTFGEGLPKGFIHFKAEYVKKKLVVKHKFVDSKPGFRFETVMITDQKQWSQLEVNAAIRYRVYVKDSITIPGDIRTRVPNIAQLYATNKKIDINNVDTIDVSEQQVSDIDPTDGLRSFLKESGIKKHMRDRAMKEIAKIRSELGTAS